MSENIRSHPCQHTLQTAPLFVFIRKIALKNQRVRIFIRLKALMKIYENNSYQCINPSRRLKMHKHTKNNPPKNPFVRKPTQNIHLTLQSFLCVFHKLLSEFCPKKAFSDKISDIFGQNAPKFVRKSDKMMIFWKQFMKTSTARDWGTFLRRYWTPCSVILGQNEDNFGQNFSPSRTKLWRFLTLFRQNFSPF